MTAAPLDAEHRGLEISARFDEKAAAVENPQQFALSPRLPARNFVKAEKIDDKDGGADHQGYRPSLFPYEMSFIANHQQNAGLKR